MCGAVCARVEGGWRGWRRFALRAAGTLLSLLLALGSAKVEAQLIDGLEGWADATLGLSTTRWAGPRVPAPVPEPRPRLESKLDAHDYPLRVHASSQVPASRAEAVLRAAVDAHVQLARAGFLTRFGDAGEGGSGARDLYLVDAPGARAALDAAGSFDALDGGRAFVLIDARLPADRLTACVSRALVEAELLELDPAEAEILRRASAAFFAARFTGEPECDDAEPARDSAASPFDLASPARGADWLARLGAQRDDGRGTFLFDMWQFARQRTWEGRDLRGSPDLFEAIDKALTLAHDELPRIAGQLADARALAGLDAPPRPLPASALPMFDKPRSIALLGSSFVQVQLQPPQPGVRLRAWARARGGRFALAASKLDARGEVLARIEAGSWHAPTSQLSVELDGDTRAVLISATNVGDGTPDFDAPSDPAELTLTVDLAR